LIQYKSTSLMASFMGYLKMVFEQVWLLGVEWGVWSWWMNWNDEKEVTAYGNKVPTRHPPRRSEKTTESHGHNSRWSGPNLNPIQTNQDTTDCLHKECYNVWGKWRISDVNACTYFLCALAFWYNMSLIRSWCRKLISSIVCPPPPPALLCKSRRWKLGCTSQMSCGWNDISVVTVIKVLAQWDQIIRSTEECWILLVVHLVYEMLWRTLYSESRKA
jgi:hypothetical protein